MPEIVKTIKISMYAPDKDLAITIPDGYNAFAVTEAQGYYIIWIKRG